MIAFKTLFNFKAQTTNYTTQMPNAGRLDKDLLFALFARITAGVELKWMCVLS
jgi:hypothetical protein